MQHTVCSNIVLTNYHFIFTYDCPNLNPFSSVFLCLKNVEYYTTDTLITLSVKTSSPASVKIKKGVITINHTVVRIENGIKLYLPLDHCLKQIPVNLNVELPALQFGEAFGDREPQSAPLRVS